MTTRSGIFLGLFFLGAFTCFAAFQSETWKVPPGLPEYEVLKVIDGDTIRVAGLGKIRYIGMDAPEIKHAGRAAEPYGYEAFEANQQLVQGKRVKIELDAGKRDRYGRVLAYVYCGSVFINAYLVEAGYAYAVKVKPNVRYWNLFSRLQQEAARAGRGLWGLRLQKRFGLLGQ
jgi:micrococcal nuclease